MINLVLSDICCLTVYQQNKQNKGVRVQSVILPNCYFSDKVIGQTAYSIFLKGNFKEMKRVSLRLFSGRINK